MKTFHFMAGLPRSGSTLLAAIMNQNPHVYVTPTSPMLDLLIDNQNAWHKNRAVAANPVDEQLTNITRGMINGAWEHRPEQIIFDKNRGWNRNINASTVLFGKEIKVLATTRDLPSIITSWVMLLEANPGNPIDKYIAEKGLEVNNRSRAFEMWFNQVQDCVEGLKQLRVDAGNRLMEVHYLDIVMRPYQTLMRIHHFFELPLPSLWYDFHNITSDTVDDDLKAWGLTDMHKIRPELRPRTTDPRQVLGDELFDDFNEIGKEYGIN